MSSTKLWDKGFEPDRMIEEYTVGQDRELDMRLARYDVEGSLAHIAMLEKIGLLTREELESNLGTIARSGSLQFKQDMAAAEGDKPSDVDIIGQFGVGFYSAFMVADRVTVTSRAYGADEAWQWESTGADGYTLTQCGKDTVGTDIVLHIKANTEDEDRATSSQTVATLSSKYVQVNGSSKTRSLVVFGSSNVFLDSFMSNAFSDASYVKDALLNLTGNSGSSVSVVTQRVQTNEMDITATRSTMDFWGIVFIAGIPVVILAAGLVIFLKRRHL